MPISIPGYYSFVLIGTIDVKALEVGMLEEGKLADLIVVDGSPLEDLSALEKVEIVVQGGEIVTPNTQY